jgi:hypothetical protein
MGIDEETRSFEELLDGATDLEDAKHAVANANKRIQNESGKSREELIEEKIEMGELDESARKLIDTNQSLSSSQKNVAASMARSRDRSNKLRRSFLAASEAGDLFENGLGALSLNVGAFTIALRNFLTQVPLIITGLGAIGSAALAAASSVSILAVSLLSLLGAGVFAQAERLQEEFAGIEERGEALQLILKSIIDLIGQAAAPLLELEDAEEIFISLIEGIGFFVSIFADAIEGITNGSDAVREFADNTVGSFFSIRDAIELIDGSSLENLAGALQEAWVILGERTVMALGGFTNALSAAIRRSTELLAEVEDLGSTIDQFTRTISELAEIGFIVGGGLLPVFEAFASVVESVAGFVNSLDEELVQNVITFAALVVASNKLAGMLGGVARVIPSMTIGFATLASSVTETMDRFDKLMRGHPPKRFTALSRSLHGVGGGFQFISASVGKFLAQTNALSGFVGLIDGVAGFNTGMRAMAFTTEQADKEIRSLALAMKASDKTMDELATGFNSAAGTSIAFSSRMADLEDELQDLAIQGKLTDEVIEDIDFDKGQFKGLSDKDELLPDATPSKKKATAIFGPLDDSVKGLNKRFEKLSPRMGAVKHGFSAFGAKSKETSEFIKAQSDATKLLIANTAGATAPTTLLAAATEALSLSTIKAAFTMGGFRLALKVAAKQLAVATIQTLSYIAAQLGLIPAALSAAGATVVLDAAITSLTGGLNKVLPAIILFITSIGALAVGVIKNMDGIKASLTSFFNIAKRVLGAIGRLILTYFIAVWDALVLAVRPIIDIIGLLADAFSMSGDSASESASLVDVFVAAMEMASAAVRGLLIAAGFIINIVLQPFVLLATAIAFVIDLFSEVLALFTGGEAAAFSLSDALIELFDVVAAGFDFIIDGMEFVVNSFIDGINGVIKAFNRLPAIGGGFTLLEQVELSRKESNMLSDDELEAEGDNTIAYNVDNSTRIDQTIDADPEDQAQLSRVVSDAIAEANSFQRRRQGAQ